MKLETTVKKIENIIMLLEVFGSKRKPLIKRKISVLKPRGEVKVHIVLGLTCIGAYTIPVADDTYFKGYTTTKSVHGQDGNLNFYIDVKDKNKDNSVINLSITHLKKINKFFKLSKPAKAQLEKLNYKNKSFKLISGEVVDITTPDFKHTMMKENDVLPRKEDLMNQKVYIHGRDPVTNSMLMSRDYDMNTFDLNRLIYEVISMNPHLVKDLHIDFYEEASNLGSKSLVMAIAITREDGCIPYQYLSIHEELHAKIVSSMPNSNNLDTKFKREEVASKYMKAFITMKENMYEQGLSPSEMKSFMGERRHNTSALKDALALQIRVKLCMAKGDFTKLEKAVFDAINDKVGIDAISLRTGINRNEESKELQNNIFRIEYNIIMYMNSISMIWSDVLGEYIPPLQYAYFIIRFINKVDINLKRFPNPHDIAESIIHNDDYPNNVYEETFIHPYDNKVTREHSKDMYLKLLKTYG